MQPLRLAGIALQGLELCGGSREPPCNGGIIPHWGSSHRPGRGGGGCLQVLWMRC